MKTDREIIEQYSDFFPNRADKTKSNMKYGFCCDVGWYPLIVTALEQLDEIEYAEFIEIVQIKEKYGTLRIYFDISKDFELKFNDNIFKRLYYWAKGFNVKTERNTLWKVVHKITAEAYNNSVTTCEICGKAPALKGYSEYWIKTVCKNCSDVFENFTYDSTDKKS
jgi:hypothetical protein